ncbi:amino acid ABC transporter substrate-binding protein [Companilactobacillus sp. RD055328]|uniref:transporter substrate-binding domain-containing protein n=1 Tax=Companilactobacillus sp. RD055328 TaxID=2916634 RepID=UPI001FC82EEB|nr:transporter substrate-binding domain-containing protein [Companilactobacillus sp. RD055328]GKQ43105.1 amino acid ABC transporter substrate-binding protein [Companilactobacillus sp. RD055328]
MRKKIFLALSALIMVTMVITGCSSNTNNLTKEKGTLTIGLEGTYAPYSYREGSKLKGFEVDYGKAVAKKLNMKVKFVPTKWDSLIAGLNTNTFDTVINNVSINKNRESHYLFSTPYIYSKSVIIVPADSTIKSATDLKGVKVAEGTGTDNYDKAEKFQADIISSPDFSSTMSMLDNGRIKATINSKEAFLTWKKSNPETTLKYIEIPDSQLKSSKIAPMFNKKSAKLSSKVTEATKELYKDGTMKKLSIKYFGEDITKK